MVWGHKRPMRLPFGALADPALQQVNLRPGQFPARSGRRHLVVGIGGRDTAHQLAMGQVAGHDGKFPVLQFLEGAFFAVKAQIGFALVFIRAVAGVTTL